MLEEEGLAQLVLEEGRVVVVEGVLELFCEGRPYWLEGAGVELGRATGVVFVRAGFVFVRFVLVGVLLVGVLLVGLELELTVELVLEAEGFVLSVAVLDAEVEEVAGAAVGLAVLPEPEGE